MAGDTFSCREVEYGRTCVVATEVASYFEVNKVLGAAVASGIEH